MKFAIASLVLVLLGCGTAAPPEESTFGHMIHPRNEWHGASCHIPDPFFALFSTEEDWKGFLSRMFDGIKDAPKVGPVDFGHEMVLVLCDGDSVNCNGISSQEVRDEDDRILVRTRHHWYQTGFGFTQDENPERKSQLVGEELPERPYGIIVLPRELGKVVVVEYNTQHYIGRPPIWKVRLQMRLDPRTGREVIIPQSK